MDAPPFTLNAWLRYDLIERTLAGLDGVESILEIGAGRGALGARLAMRYRYVGVEPDELSCEAAKEVLGRVGSGEMVCGDVSALPEDDVFDAVCAFEVLEHIEDDAGALRAWRERLRPDGRLLMSVPLYQRRYAAADRFVGHFRRYDPEPLGELLRETGYADVKLMTFGFPLGHVLEKSRNLLARVAKPDESQEERTGASGRRFQPTGRKGIATQALSAPFRDPAAAVLRHEAGRGPLRRRPPRGLVRPTVLSHVGVERQPNGRTALSPTLFNENGTDSISGTRDAGLVEALRPRRLERLAEVRAGIDGRHLAPVARRLPAPDLDRLPPTPPGRLPQTLTLPFRSHRRRTGSGRR